MHRIDSNAAGIPADFFAQEATVVARGLIGQLLCRQLPDGTALRWPITETEAYPGPEDAACHAHLNRRTRRTEVMFGPPGHWYVYLCYGVHWLLNIVVRETGHPAAVLIRGAGDFDGPGKLTKAMQVNKIQNTEPATPATQLWCEFSDITVPESEISITPRIGINYASDIWIQAPLRWVWKQ